MLNKTYSLLAAITISAVLLPAQVLAEAKVAAVNASKILEAAPQAEAARKRLEKEFAPRDKKLVGIQKSIKKLEDKLSRDSAVMSETERRKLEREIVSKKRDLKRSQDEFREDFNIRRNEEFGKLQRRVYQAIVTHAKENNFDMVVGDGVIYASDKVDITQQVLKRLQKETSSNKK